MHEHTSYAIGWGTLSLINAGLAQAKGRSGLLWWLASLFIGPLATFLIVVLPAVQPIVTSSEEERPLPVPRYGHSLFRGHAIQTEARAPGRHSA